MVANEYDRALEQDYLYGVVDFPEGEEDFWFEFASMRSPGLTREEWLKEVYG